MGPDFVLPQVAPRYQAWFPPAKQQQTYDKTHWDEIRQWTHNQITTEANQKYIQVTQYHQKKKKENVETSP